MSARIASRYFVRRLSSGGKVLSEEEKAAENVYIKKIEQEKMEKLARKGPKPVDQPTPESTVATEVNPTATWSSSSSSTAGISNDRNRNYAVLAGTITGLSALGWYLLSKPNKSEEIPS